MFNVSIPKPSDGQPALEIITIWFAYRERNLSRCTTFFSFQGCLSRQKKGFLMIL